MCVDPGAMPIAICAKSKKTCASARVRLSGKRTARRGNWSGKPIGFAASFFLVLILSQQVVVPGLARYDQISGPAFIPLAFEADNQTLVVATSPGRDTMAVYRYDPEARKLGEVVAQQSFALARRDPRTAAQLAERGLAADRVEGRAVHERVGQHVEPVGVALEPPVVDEHPAQSHVVGLDRGRNAPTPTRRLWP